MSKKRKVCRTCGVEKTVAAFPPFLRNGKRDYRAHCRVCYRIRKREDRAASPNTSGVPRIPGQAELVAKRRCSTCGVVKSWAEFAPRAYREDGSVRSVASSCRLCRARIQREWRRNNRAKDAERKREWRRVKRLELVEDREQDGRLVDAAPFVRFVRARLDEGWSHGVLADHAEISDRALRRVLSGETLQVRVGVVDRLTLALGYHIDDVERMAA